MIEAIAYRVLKTARFFADSNIVSLPNKHAVDLQLGLGLLGQFINEPRSLSSILVSKVNLYPGPVTEAYSDLAKVLLATPSNAYVAVSGHVAKSVRCQF